MNHRKDLVCVVYEVTVMTGDIRHKKKKRRSTQLLNELKVQTALEHSDSVTC